MANTLYPGFVHVFYASAYGSHRMTIPVEPNLLAGIYYLKSATGVDTVVSTGVSAYVDILKALVPASVAFSGWELWTITNPGDDTIYRDGGTLTQVGTAGTLFVAGQVSFSYRSLAGGNGRVMMLDCGLAPNNKYLAPSYGGNAPIQALAAYLLSDACIVKARDNSRPKSGIKAVTKTNDALRKRYNLV